jgi:CubicO group peptidase (beta-lactamase class C family)
MKRLLVFLFLIVVFNCPSYGQDINTAKLDSFLNLLASKNLVMGSIAISKEGVTQYQKAMGYAYPGMATINTRYRIGSATKMFTAVIIFQLIEEGKLTLDQKLGGYFPELPNAGKITIRNMLYHRSGLHDYTHDTNFDDWMDKPTSHEKLLKIIADKGSDFEPGTKADYCNSNYLLLGFIIEKICKMPYADVVKERITSKLDLKDTYCGNGTSREKNESVPYKYSNGSWNTVKATNLNIHGGAGCLISTPADLVKFINALFSGKLVSQSSLAEMETMIGGYGMGMFPDKYGTEPSFGHNGRIEEFYTAVWYFPKQKLAFAYCTNGIDYPRVDLLDGVLKICFNQPFTLPFSNNLHVKSNEPDKYLGKYSSDQITVNCTKSGDTLLVETKGKLFKLQPVADNYFMDSPMGYFFEFNPEKNTLQVKETDNVYYLKKQE